MEWWNDFVGWFYSNDGKYVVAGVVLPALAILVAGVLGAWIATSATKRLLKKHDREQKNSAIALLIDAAQQASVWNSLTPGEQVLSDRAVGQADIQVRLLPIKGSSIAADWAARMLAQMRRNSATFGYEVEPAVIEFRDRLLEWQGRPKRARKVFETDLERWSTEEISVDSVLEKKQDAWVAAQHHERFVDENISAAAPEPAVDTQAIRAEQARKDRLIEDAAARADVRRESTVARESLATEPAKQAPIVATGIADEGTPDSTPTATDLERADSGEVTAVIEESESLEDTYGEVPPTTGEVPPPVKALPRRTND